MHSGKNMALALNMNHLRLYRNLGRLFLKYGRSGMMQESELESLADHALPNGSSERSETAKELADDLEAMGPIFVKLGQVMSSRSDLLPAPYLEALTRLQDNLEPIPFGEIERTIEEELGVRISKAFSDFNPQPIGVASLGQVHRAAMRDGRPVVVKVQRPGIRKQISEDMDGLEQLTRLADQHTDFGRRQRFTEVIEEFRKTLARELDYRQEASNLRVLGASLRDYPHLLVPSPVDDYTTSRVLTMDYIHGAKITEISPLARLDMDGQALADELFQAYLQNILIDGLFHADPHAGNVLVTPDHKIALIDLGMVGHVSPGLQENLLKILLATSEGRSDEAADIAIKIGERLDNFDETAFRRLVSDLVTARQHATIESLAVGRVMLDLGRVSGETGLHLPSELTMLGKTLLNLDEIGRILAPDLDPNESIRRHAGEIVRQRMLKSISPGNLLSAAMDAKEMAQEMPGRVNRILDTIARNQLKIKVDAIDEATLMEGFQKVANRITMGLVLAALIIGASMLMRVETSFQILGYPGFAMLCFLAAAGGGFWLLVTIALSDRAQKRTQVNG
jgi:ubiquinone biosynthesis protein